MSDTPKMPGEVTCEHGDWADFCRFCWMKYAHALKHALDDKEREVAEIKAKTIEECAKVCDEFVERIEKSDSVSMSMQHHQGATYGAMLCADKIRALFERQAGERP